MASRFTQSIHKTICKLEKKHWADIQDNLIADKTEQLMLKNMERIARIDSQGFQVATISNGEVIDMKILDVNGVEHKVDDTDCPDNLVCANGQCVEKAKETPNYIGRRYKKGHLTVQVSNHEEGKFTMVITQDSSDYYGRRIGHAIIISESSLKDWEEVKYGQCMKAKHAEPAFEFDSRRWAEVVPEPINKLSIMFEVGEVWYDRGADKLMVYKGIASKDILKFVVMHCLSSISFHNDRAKTFTYVASSMEEYRKPISKSWLTKIKDYIYNLFHMEESEYV